MPNKDYLQVLKNATSGAVKNIVRNVTTSFANRPSAFDEAVSAYKRFQGGDSFQTPRQRINQQVNDYLPQFGNIISTTEKAGAQGWDYIKRRADEYLPQFAQKAQDTFQTSKPFVGGFVGQAVQNIKPEAFARNVQPTLNRIGENFNPYSKDPNATINKLPVLGGVRQFTRENFGDMGYGAWKKSLNPNANLTPEERQQASDYNLNFFPVGGIASKGKELFGKTVTEKVMEKAGQVVSDLRKGGRNQFTNVKVYDNPLLLGKDWRNKIGDVVKTQVDKIKARAENFGSPDFIDEINKIEKLSYKPQTPVTQKVNLLDYFRTPDRVLTKIGLGDEAKFLRTQYDDYVQELPKEIGRVTEWFKQVPAKESAVKIFRWLDGQEAKLLPAELKVAKEVKGYLAHWADKLGLPQDKRIANYITHLFEDDFVKKEFDEELAKLITNKVPGSVYNPFLQKRLGMYGYKENVWEALDAYVKRASRAYYMNPALDRIAQKSVNLEQSQLNYLTRYTSRINLRPTEMDNLIDNMLKSSPIGYKLGQRPIANLTRQGRQMVYRGTLGLNVTTAIKNLTQGANTYARLGEKYTAQGYLNLVKNWRSDELQKVGVLADNFIQDRSLNATKKFFERFDRGLFYLFETAEKINRGSAYYGAKAKALAEGKSAREAVEFAKQMVRDTQFTFNQIDTPVAMSSDIAKLFTQFQSFTIKQAEFLGETVSQKDFAGLARWLGSSLAMVYLVGKTVGLEPKDLIPGSSILSGETRLGETPLIQAGRAGLQTIFGDEQKREEALDELGRTARTFIPGGVQLFKSGEALGSMLEGGSFTPTGRLRFEVKPSLQPSVFGIWRTKEAQEYIDEREGKNLSGEEQEAKKFEKEQTEGTETERRLGGRLHLQLNKVQSPEDKKEMLKAWDQQGLLSKGVLNELKRTSKNEKKEGFSNIAKAVDLINTNEGRALFIARYFKQRGLTPEQKKAILEDLDSAGLLTKDLRKKIIKAVSEQ